MNKTFKIKPLKNMVKLSKGEIIEREAISNLRKSFDKYLLSLENVRGVFTGYKIKNGKLTDRLSILVGVVRKIPANKLNSRQIIPTAIKTVHKNKVFEIVTDVISIGEPKLAGRRDNALPALSGDSIGQDQLDRCATLVFCYS